jgi:hypothetical protein
MPPGPSIQTLPLNSTSIVGRLRVVECRWCLRRSCRPAHRDRSAPDAIIRFIPIAIISGASALVAAKAHRHNSGESETCPLCTANKTYIRRNKYAPHQCPPAVGHTSYKRPSFPVPLFGLLEQFASDQHASNFAGAGADFIQLSVT